MEEILRKLKEMRDELYSFESSNNIKVYNFEKDFDKIIEDLETRIEILRQLTKGN